MTATQPPLRPRTAADNQNFIKQRIKSYILTHNLEPGDVLPTEQNLMTLLGVGRHPLREAIKSLEAVGIVEVRHGYGTYVGSLSLRSLEDGLAFRVSRNLQDLKNVLDVREALEVGLADRVINYYQGQGYEHLASIVDAMEDKAAHNESIRKEDLEFHRALYEPLGNQLIIDLLGVFWRTFADVDKELPAPTYSLATAASWHRELLNSIRDISAADFTRNMKTHFTGIRTRFDDQ